MHKERVVVYPYDAKFATVLRHRKLCETLDFVGVASPSGWGLTGKDAGFSDYGSDTGLIVENRFEHLLDLCDTVWFVQSETQIDFEKLIYPKIAQAIQSRKNIICSLDLKGKERGLKELCIKHNVYLRYFKSTFNLDELKDNMKSRRIQFNKFETPIIAVSGCAEGIHKFEIQLALREHLANMGYRVSQIGSRNYCELLGFHSFPGFMYECGISESDKVLLFNDYIKKIELEEVPDIIILGVPGGIMPVHENSTDGFGILHYEVFQAVTPDAAILSILYSTYNEDFFDKLYNIAKYRFGFEIDCCSMANKFLDWVELSNYGIESYCAMSSSSVDSAKLEYSEKNNIPTFNPLNGDDTYKLTSYLVDKLAQ
ncbi:MAG: TIGR04066 family peptide maturation system protein [Clostridia bacterium]|nr:TIGR04066 family peptide maturation system protein [Clostridia bacterium]